MSKFKVGDIVKGNGDLYGVTDVNMVRGRITEIDKYGDLEIEILQHLTQPNEVGETYDMLDEREFDLVENNTKISFTDRTNINTISYIKGSRLTYDEVHNNFEKYKDKIAILEEANGINREIVKFSEKNGEQCIETIYSREYWKPITDWEMNEYSAFYKEENIIYEPVFIKNETTEEILFGEILAKIYTCSEILADKNANRIYISNDNNKRKMFYNHSEGSDEELEQGFYWLDAEKYEYVKLTTIEVLETKFTVFDLNSNNISLEQALNEMKRGKCVYSFISYPDSCSITGYAYDEINKDYEDAEFNGTVEQLLRAKWFVV